MNSETPTTEAPSEVKPGTATSEFKVAGGVSLALIIPIVQTMLNKAGDTTVEVICLTVVAVAYIASRTFAKR